MTKRLFVFIKIAASLASLIFFMNMVGCTESDKTHALNDNNEKLNDSSRSRSISEALSKLTHGGWQLKSMHSFSDSLGQIQFQEGVLERPNYVSKKFAVWKDGTLMSRIDAHKKYMQQHISRHGRVSLEDIIRIETGNISFPVEVVIWLRKNQLFQSKVALSNIKSITDIHSDYPFVFSSVNSKQELKLLSGISGVESIAIESDTTAIIEAQPGVMPTGAEYTKTLVEFNNINYIGNQRKIAITEGGVFSPNLNASCQINASHESLANNNLFYATNDNDLNDDGGSDPTWPFQTCVSDVDCKCGTRSGIQQGICFRTSASTTFHPNSVASCIAMNMNNIPYHASGADIYIANRPEQNFCSAEGIVHSMEWLKANDVYLLTQSFTCGRTDSLEMFDY